jgi:hypothetical protein
MPELSLKAIVSRRKNAETWSWLFPGLVTLTGLMGLLDEVRTNLAPWIDVQAISGALLSSFVLVSYYSRLRWAPFGDTAAVVEFSRRVSRVIYLTLYLSIGLRQVIACLNLLHQHTQPRDLTNVARSAEPSIFVVPSADLKITLVYGLVALVVARTLAVWISLDVADEVASRNKPAAEFAAKKSR